MIFVDTVASEDQERCDVAGCRRQARFILEGRRHVTWGHEIRSTDFYCLECAKEIVDSLGGEIRSTEAAG